MDFSQLQSLTILQALMPEETIAGPKYSTYEYSIDSKLMA